jgi:AAA domain
VIKDVGPSLVIFDTQARVTVGAEENSSKDMGMFVDALEVLRRDCGACILVVHHEPRNGDNLRGSIALEGAATSIMRLNKDGGIITLSNPKQKDVPEAPDMALTLKQVGGSAVLENSHSGVGIPPTLNPAEAQLTRLMWEGYGNSQVSKTELKAVSAMPDTSFYRTLNSLVNRGFVTQAKVGNSKMVALRLGAPHG